MPRAYSLDLRERTMRARDAGLAPLEIERTFGISIRTQARWVRLVRQGDSVRPKQSTGRKPKIDPSAYADLRAQVAAHPDATLAEHCDRWEHTHEVRVSTATMSRLLTRLGLSLKKRRWSLASRTP